MQYRVVIFDFWQTLVQRPFQYNIYQTLAEHLKVEIQVVLEVASLTILRRQELDLEEFARRLGAYLQEDNQEFEQETYTERIRDGVREALHRFQEATAEPQLVEGALDTLDRLSTRGVPRVLVANGTWHTRAVLERSAAGREILKRMTDVRISCEVGWVKPNPRIFLASPVVREVWRNGEPMCVIGDQFDADILAAQILGADAIWFRLDRSKSELGGRRQECGPAIAVARNYAEVNQLLGLEGEPCNSIQGKGQS